MDARTGWAAVSVGALVSAAADRRIRRGVRQLYYAVDGVIHNPPMEWEDPESGEVAETEHMTRRMRWTITRPMWTRRLGAVALSCGCGRAVTGRMAWFAADCPKHSSFGAYRVGRKEFLERADWDDVLEVVQRLAAEGPEDEVKPTNDRGFLGFGEIADTNGGAVRVYESSAFMSGDEPGPFVWLNVDASAWLNAPDVAEVSRATAHLNRDQAARTVRALVRWLAEHEEDEDG